MRFSGRVHVRTWLLAIARNTARESWRKRKKALSLEDETSSPPASTPMDAAEAHRALHLAIRDLPPKQRVAITLVYLDGFTQSDAALKVNCAAAAFRRRLACGRSRLRRLLNADDLV
jgi:RNA polymerase sigma-70 factor (ECF subfamily)